MDNYYQSIAPTNIVTSHTELTATFYTFAADKRTVDFPAISKCGADDLPDTTTVAACFAGDPFYARNCLAGVFLRFPFSIHNK